MAAEKSKTRAFLTTLEQQIKAIELFDRGKSEYKIAEEFGVDKTHIQNLRKRKAEAVESLIRQGANVNERSRDGMTPLGIAAFWGYADIVELLLNHGADINLANKGTLWTPLHSAAFQGHGKVIMKLMDHNPDITLKDNQGRTATDFASAMDAIWPFFAAAGCRRTIKAQLIDMDIVKKVTTTDPTIPKSEYAHFSRPGSAYVMKPQQMQYSDTRMAVASQTGDVLAGISEENEQPYVPMFGNVWNN